MKKQKAIVLNDLHIPFEDERAVNLVIDFIRYFKPDVLILNGDIADFWQISSFVKDPVGKLMFSDELKKVKEYLALFTHLVKKVVYVSGNHEIRLRKYILVNAKALIHLEGLSVEEQLGLKNLGIQYIKPIGKEASYLYGDALIGHFNKVNKHSAYTAKNLLEEKGISLIQAHTHRAGIHLKTTYNKTLVAIENGCLCKLDPEYVANPNWQQSFTAIYKDSKGHCEPHLIVIDKYKFNFGKKTFKS